MNHPRRLIEVDLPIARISAHARREKSIRHGHISTLHIWWARRPLAACRAVICAALWPDPADPNCPPAFRVAAIKNLTAFAKRVCPERITQEKEQLQSTASPESLGRWEAIAKGTLSLDPNEEADWGILRFALLDFIADFANWDNSTVPAYLETSRALTQAAHEALGGEPGTRPLVVDPFAGGGSIPLEALRVGADAFASDLNPVAVLLNKVVLEYIPKYGQKLADEVRKWGAWIKEQAEKELAEFYPKDPDGATPIAYLWARTIKCEGPGCGTEVPLLRSLWLAKKATKSVALKAFPHLKQKRVDFEVLNPARAKDVGDGFVKRGSVTCPCCGFTTPVKSVREQLIKQRGGAASSRMFCVATSRPGTLGRQYRIPNERDLKAVAKAVKTLQRSVSNTACELSCVPDEPLPLMSGVFNAPIYGHTTWGSLFNSRQTLVMLTVSRLVREVDLLRVGDDSLRRAIRVCLALAVGRCANQFTSLSKWNTGRELVDGLFARQAIPMLWDYGELNFLEGDTYWSGAISWIVAVLERNRLDRAGQAERSDAAHHVLPSDSVQAVFTDPPYYNAVPYADLSDFFYVWQKRMLRSEVPDVLSWSESPKAEEICEMSGWDPLRYAHKTGKWFEERMEAAMSEARRVLSPFGIGVIVFAHKSTGGWESLLQAMLNAGWTITASWPVDTEMGNRLRAMNSAALASSVHLVCRPREDASGNVSETVGEWRDVIGELPKRIHEWMPRLAAEGVVGADAIFACLGPALEVYSRYSRVEKANGEQATLREYLEFLWAAVSTEALALIFKEADASGLEPDARLTAMWLWTLGGGAANGNGKATTADSEEEESETEDDDEEETSSKTKAKTSGFILEFDAARKIAQGLGVHLEQCGSLVEIKGDKARLLPVAERTAFLFGKGAEAATVGRGRKAKAKQRSLFEELSEAENEAAGWGELHGPAAGTTVLDRVHQAMILFAANRGELLKRFLVEDGIGKDSRFWKLSDNLNKLYPPGTDERRWIEGVLARKKGLGL